MLSLALLFLALAPAPRRLFQEPTDKAALVDERPEIKAMFDELVGYTKLRGEKDPEAVTVVDKLTQEFPKSGPKDRAAIVKALGDCFDVKRPKELEPGV